MVAKQRGALVMSSTSFGLTRWVILSWRNQQFSEVKFWNALEYEAKTDAAEIDDFREGVIKKRKQWAV